MNPNDVFSTLVALMIIFILGNVVVFFVTRGLKLWYWKVNERLEEQRKTNELLQNIYDALVQGNNLSAFGIEEAANSRVEQITREDESRQKRITKAGEVDNSLPPL